MLFSAFPAANISANAAGYGYARAETANAYFYREKNNSTILFAVPKGYCIEILREDGDWYYARYANDSGIYREKLGYCHKEQFTTVEGVPSVTYLYKTVSVNFKADKVSGVLPTLGDVSLEAAYYGALTLGDISYAYVYCQGTFGYIEGKFDDFELNLPTPKPDDKSEGSGGSGAGLNFATIAFIVIASLSVVVILIIYFTTKKPRIDG